MASIAVTITAANGDAGYILRRLARQVESAAAHVPDRVTTGASTVMTITDNPSTGHATVQITGGPYASSTVYPV